MTSKDSANLDLEAELRAIDRFIPLFIFIDIDHPECAEKMNIIAGEINYGANFDYKNKNIVECDYTMMFPVYKICPNMIDWKKYFREVDNSMVHACQAISSAYFKQSKKYYVEYLDWLLTYPLYKIYDDPLTAEQRKHIKILEEIRYNNKELFCVDLFDSDKSFALDLRYNPINDNVYKFEDMPVIAGIPKPHEFKENDVVINEYKICVDRLNAATCGLLDKSINPKLDKKSFPFTNTIIAGGSVFQIIGNGNKPLHRQSDIDIFIIGSAKNRKSTLVEVLNWFDSPNTYYGVIGGVVYIYITNIDRMFQIISSNAESGFDVINKYDHSGVKFYITKERNTYKFVGLPCAVKALTERTVRFNVKCAAGNTKICRVFKILINGLRIRKDDPIREFLDISLLFEKNNVLEDLMSSYLTYWTPNMINYKGMEDDVRDSMILASIKKETFSTIQTKNITDIINNVSLGCDFQSTYNARAYSEYTKELFIYPNKYSSKTETLKFKNGYAFNEKFTVKSIVNDENYHKITVACSSDFADWYNEIVSFGASKVYNKNIHNFIVNNEFVINVSENKTDRIYYDSNGDYINPLEENVINANVNIISYIIIKYNARQNNNLTPSLVPLVVIFKDIGDANEDADKDAVEDTVEELTTSACNTTHAETIELSYDD